MITPIELACANMNWGPREFATLGIGGAERFLAKTGYQNLEVTPVRSRLHLELLGQWARQRTTSEQGSAGEAAERLVGSVHQSWRAENGLKVATTTAGQLARGEIAESAQTILSMAMLEVNSSVKTIERYQELASGAVAAVLYPPSGKNKEWDDQNAPFLRRLLQPAPEVWQQWEIGSVEEMAIAMQQHGFNGLCIDTFHLRRLSKDGTFQLPPWEEFLVDVESNEIPIHEVHLAQGRVDYAKYAVNDAGAMHQKTIEEYQMSLRGPEAMRRTEQGQLLLGVAAVWTVQQQQRQWIQKPELRVVTEIPAAVVEGDLGIAHRQVVENTTALFQM